MLLVSAVQGFCSLPYTFRYVFVNARSLSQIIAHVQKLFARPRPNISAEGLHFSALSYFSGSTSWLQYYYMFQILAVTCFTSIQLIS